MALLGIINRFKAMHGSIDIKENDFKIEIKFQGYIADNFVAGIDHIQPKQKLNDLLKELDGKYLDDIVGRATNENIATYIFFQMREFPVYSVCVYEGESQYVEVFRTDIDFNFFPALLFYNKARSLLFRGKPKLAIVQLVEALKIKADYAEAYNLRGRCNRILKNWDAALPDFLKAVEINPNFGEAYRNIGNCYLYLSQYDLMIPAFDKAVELMPESALTINNRGFAYMQLGNAELAMHDHKRAIELDPNYAEAHRDLATALLAIGDNENARKYSEIADSLVTSGKDTYANKKMY